MEFHDRYSALGMKYPDAESVCRGACEGTGCIPVYANNPHAELRALWRSAEDANPSDDGCHFVTCPTCKGTGEAA